MTEINWNAQKLYIDQRKEITEKLKKTIVEALNLDIDPKLIQEDQPLFGRGLELDSIDALELSLHVAKNFGVEISDDDKIVLSSVNRLADFVIENRG